MTRATLAEEGTAAEEDGTATDAADQEEAMILIKADGRCGAAIQEEVAAPKKRGDGGVAKEEDNHHMLEEAALGAADGEGGNGGAGMLGDIFFMNINNQK